MGKQGKLSGSKVASAEAIPSEDRNGTNVDPETAPEEA